MSPAERLALLPKAERDAWLRELDPSAADALRFEWRRFWARPDQLAPQGDWATWLICAGRGWGKTRTGAEWVIQQAYDFPGSVGHLVAATPGEAARAMVGGEARGSAATGEVADPLAGLSGILDISPPWFRPKWTGGEKGLLVWPNGTKALVFSAHNYEALRGPQCHWAWCDELAKWRYQQAAWDMLQFGLRLGDHTRCCVTTTPRVTPLLKAIVQDQSTVVTRGTTYDNLGNLAENFKRQLLRKYEGTRLGRQELLAELLEDITGALWTHSQLDGIRCPAPALHELVRVVVGVDPSGTGTDDETQEVALGDEQGIVVAGLLQDGTAVVLDDASCRLTPDGWGRAVIECAEQWRADCAVAEVNFGGQMVEYVIRQSAINLGKSLRVVVARASRGKHQRAEPVSALYEQGKVRHAGTFSELEDQLCAFTPRGYTGGGSPDRADGLVWALTELVLEGGAAGYDGIKRTHGKFRRR